MDLRNLPAPATGEPKQSCRAMVLWLVASIMIKYDVRVDHSLWSPTRQSQSEQLPDVQSSQINLISYEKHPGYRL
jgi:hypothetical protein